MPDAACGKCGAAAGPEGLLQGLCVTCVFALADSQSKLTRERVKELAEAVRTETAGLFRPEALRAILEEFWHAALNGADMDLEVERTMVVIQRAGGLGACRDMMELAEGFRQLALKTQSAISEFAESMEEEVRRKIRVLSADRKDKA